MAPVVPTFPMPSFCDLFPHQHYGLPNHSVSPNLTTLRIRRTTVEYPSSTSGPVIQTVPTYYNVDHQNATIRLGFHPSSEPDSRTVPVVRHRPSPLCDTSPPIDGMPPPPTQLLAHIPRNILQHSPIGNDKPIHSPLSVQCRQLQNPAVANETSRQCDDSSSLGSSGPSKNAIRPQTPLNAMNIAMLSPCINQASERQPEFASNGQPTRLRTSECAVDTLVQPSNITSGSQPVGIPSCTGIGNGRRHRRFTITSKRKADAYNRLAQCARESAHVPVVGAQITAGSRGALTSNNLMHERECSNCSTKVTRQWVRGDSQTWLCHCCGQFWRRNGYPRPKSLWNRPTVSRRSRKRRVASGDDVGPCRKRSRGVSNKLGNDAPNVPGGERMLLEQKPSCAKNAEQGTTAVQKSTV